MSFLLSKIVWTLLAPGTLLLLVLLGALLWRRRTPRISNALLTLGLLFVIALDFVPLAHYALAPLENRFPMPKLPERVDGIIVLGGAIETVESMEAHQPELDDAAERITAFVALARRYPEARLIYTGGSGLVRDPTHREADVAAPLFESLGVDAQRLTLERDSRNTWENAVFSKRLMQPKPGETWLLVTSAWHMPRSMGVFRAAGWTVNPYPVDYLSLNPQWAEFEPAGQLMSVSLAEKEWIGLLAYHAMGRTDAVFPAP